MNQLLTIELANKINTLHGGLRNKAKLLISDAIEIGKLLSEAREKSEANNFEKWTSDNVNFSKMTVYNYISIFNYKNQITQAENLTAAYKLIETLEAQKKQSETAKAYKRVDEYKKTGVKPDGWRRGTDDKLAKEETDRDARIKAVKQDALKRDEEKQKKEQEREKQKIDWDAKIEKDRIRSERLHSETEAVIRGLGKRAAFKEKIRISAEGINDPFQDALIDYLEGIDNDNRRIEACYNIIKICKKIAVELQKVKTA